MEFHLGDLLECVADAVPDREALACGDRRLSYRRLDERATQLAHALADAGVAQGDHVGLYLYNGAEFIESLIAVFKIRAVPINVNYRYVDSELRYLFDNADAVAVIHQREFAPRLATIVSDLPKLRICVCVEDSSGADLSRLRPLDYEQVLAEGSPERNFGPRSSGDLYIAYTGGTTGLPKGVMWRHEDLLFGALMGGNPWGEPLSRPEEIAATAASAAPFCALPAAPLMHVAAQWTALIYLLGGAKVVLSPGPGFDPDRIWRLVEQEKVQALSIVGDAMARPLADSLARPEADYDTSSLMVIGSGGATFSPAVKAQLAERLPGVILMDTFGGSEGGYQGRGVGLESGSGGPKFQADETTAVFDEGMNPIEPGSGKIGRLARRGHIPIGYYKDEEKTAATFVEIGGVRWVMAGDMATVEADGSITLLGRGSSCINTGGEKVFPEEVEAVLRQHPRVFDALVVGVPDKRFGQRVAAVVAPREGQTVTLEEIDAHCRAHIAGYKVPRVLCIVERIERQPSGKPDYEWARAVATKKLSRD